MKPIEITVPGSKSLTNRAILMASMSDGLSIVKNISHSQDSQIMVKVMRKLGVKIKKKQDELHIVGNKGVFSKFNGTINVGNAGTVARFLTAIIALVPGKVDLIKSKRMSDRPIKELIKALKIVKTGTVAIRGDVSSQFISSLMMIAPVLDKGLVINITGRMISSSYINMTIDLLKKFGIKVEEFGQNKYVIKKQSYKHTDYVVESDMSGASYFFAAAVLTGKRIRVNNINHDSVQGDKFFPDLLKKMGCEIKKNIKESWVEVKGPKVLKGITVDMNDMPDTAQTLAVLAAFVKGKTKIIGLTTLKVKETDRLLALKTELKKMQIKSEITDDSITIFGGTPKQAVIETYHDHRMAMAFAVAKLKIPGLIIKNSGVVKKSFPEFWKKFNLIKI